MNGVHDLGGMDGFTLPERDQDFPLHEQWERDLWGVIFALRGVPGTGGGSRAAIERMPPELYLGYPYFGKWLHVREQILVENGVVTTEELENPEGPLTPFDVPAGFRPPTPEQAVAFLGNDVSELLEADVDARFTVGDAVRARNEHPPGHTRMPRYVRGHVGTVVTAHGPHRFQDELPAGTEVGPQHLYTVAFNARELWGRRGHANDTIHVELWEYHLESA
jgi:nitrile hydratase beta subunit